MGMMIFTMASGLTLAFGMMDVLNFGHGAFIALGAYVATLVFLPLAAWSQADSLRAQSRRVRARRCWPRVIVCGALGFVFERVLIVPVYGQHLKQILVTIGGSIVAEQLLYALFGPAADSDRAARGVPRLASSSATSAIEKYRLRRDGRSGSSSSSRRCSCSTAPRSAC